MSSPLAEHWTLDPSVVFLNHGSFGACPRAVLESQAQLRGALEREPITFMEREYEGRLDAARKRVATFVGAAPENLVFVPNATNGVSSVLRSLPLSPGDELLCTDHGYNACNNAVRFAAERSGARARVVPLPFPTAGPDAAFDALVAAVTDRTRLVLVDHVTSPTGLVLPVERLVSELEPRGVRVLVDGAHGPGMLDLDLEALGASYYTGNLHKWCCAPKGAAILHVRPDRQSEVRPAVISHGANTRRTDRSRFQVEFDWTGTDDPTPLFAAADALDHLESLVDGGWPAIREHNRRLVIEGRTLLCEAVGATPPCPETMLGSLASVVLPDDPGPPPAAPLFRSRLHERLFRQHRIEVPIVPWPSPPQRLVRISAHVYNTRADYERLAEALVTELAAERAGR